MSQTLERVYPSLYEHAGMKPRIVIIRKVRSDASLSDSSLLDCIMFDMVYENKLLMVLLINFEWFLYTSKVVA